MHQVKSIVVNDWRYIFISAIVCFIIALGMFGYPKSIYDGLWVIGGVVVPIGVYIAMAYAIVRILPEVALMAAKHGAIRCKRCNGCDFEAEMEWPYIKKFNLTCNLCGNLQVVKASSSGWQII